jgi:hypothetical protein
MNEGKIIKVIILEIELYLKTIIYNLFIINKFCYV